MSEDTARGVLVRAIVAAFGLVLVAVLLIDWNSLVWVGGKQGTNDAQLRGNPVRIEAHVSGYVTRVPVDDNQPVHKGQTLYEIERDTYDIDLRRNEAATREAEAAVAETEARIALQQAQVAAAAASVQANRADLGRAQLELARQNALRGTEGGRLQDWQNAQAQDREQRDSVAAGIDRVSEAQARIRILQARLAQQRATVAQQRAQADLSRIDVGYTTITAPADGVVTSRLVYPGTYITPGTQLITFVPLAEIWAVANYREEQLNGMRAGQPAEIRIDAWPGITLRGEVDSIGPTSQARTALLPPDRATGNFTKVVQRVPVKITFDPGPLAGRLQPGLSVETHVDTSAPGHAP